ncbi:hypothetical protein PENTCL1PPCAC_22263, partial [Pristionchus entomophagus]
SHPSLCFFPSILSPMCVITCCGGRGCCGRCCNCVTCCFPIRGCAFTFVFISFLLQIAMCTFFLVFEVWWTFIAVGIVILFHLYFICISRGQRFFLLHLFTTYESIVSVVYLALFVWSIVIVIWPDNSANPFWDYFYSSTYNPYSDPNFDYDTAKDNTVSLAIGLMGLSFGSAIVQAYTSRVLFAYKKWLELQAVKNRLNRHHSSHHHAPQVTVITNTPVYTIQPPSAPYYPPPPPPP